MTALPSQPSASPSQPSASRPLLTVPEYAALPEDPDGPRYELVEGNLVITATEPFPVSLDLDALV